MYFNRKSRKDSKKEFLIELGYFYKTESRDLLEAQDRLQKVGIKDVSVKKRFFRDPEFTIHCSRPGILIGKNGSNIDRIKSYMKSRFGFKTNVKIVESKVDSYLMFTYL